MKTGDELKLSEFECADCGATINEGEYVTFGVCDKCFQKNYRERMGLPEEKKNTMENMTKEQAIDFLREYAKCGIHHNYTEPENKLKKMGECIAVLTASGSVAAPKEEEKSINNPEWHIKVLKDRIAESEKQYNELESENTALRESLKELIKFADIYIKSKVLEYARGNFEKSQLEDSAAIIERARKLISK